MTTTNALNTRDFYPVLREIRIVGPGKTRGYPYPVCKKNLSQQACHIVMTSDRSRCVVMIRIDVSTTPFGRRMPAVRTSLDYFGLVWEGRFHVYNIWYDVFV